MLVCIALFVWDPLHLSNVALILPGVLIVVTMGAVAWALAGAWRSDWVPAGQPFTVETPPRKRRTKRQVRSSTQGRGLSLRSPCC